jgi:CDI immunity proteins
MENFDISKTLDELEGIESGEPTFHSALVIECTRLRKVPLAEFTAGNLRIMIGQKTSLEYLLPLALEKLSENPFVMGNFYRGDLLVNVLRVSNEFWEQHQDLYWQLIELTPEIEGLKETIDEEMMPEIQRLRQLVQTF